MRTAPDSASSLTPHKTKSKIMTVKNKRWKEGKTNLGMGKYGKWGECHLLPSGSIFSREGTAHFHSLASNSHPFRGAKQKILFSV